MKPPKKEKGATYAPMTTGKVPSGTRTGSRLTEDRASGTTYTVDRQVSPDVLPSDAYVKQFMAKYNKAYAAGKMEDPLIRKQYYDIARRKGIPLPTYRSPQMQAIVENAERNAAAPPEESGLERFGDYFRPTLGLAGLTATPGLLASRITGDPIHAEEVMNAYDQEAEEARLGSGFVTGAEQGLPGGLGALGGQRAGEALGTKYPKVGRNVGGFGGAVLGAVMGAGGNQWLQRKVLGDPMYEDITRRRAALQQADPVGFGVGQAVGGVAPTAFMAAGRNAAGKISLGLEDPRVMMGQAAQYLRTPRNIRNMMDEASRKQLTAGALGAAAGPAIGGVMEGVHQYQLPPDQQNPWMIPLQMALGAALNPAAIRGYAPTQIKRPDVGTSFDFPDPMINQPAPPGNAPPGPPPYGPEMPPMIGPQEPIGPKPPPLIGPEPAPDFVYRPPGRPGMFPQEPIPGGTAPEGEGLFGVGPRPRGPEQPALDFDAPEKAPAQRPSGFTTERMAGGNLSVKAPNGDLFLISKGKDGGYRAMYSYGKEGKTGFLPGEFPDEASARDAANAILLSRLPKPKAEPVTKGAGPAPAAKVQLEPITPTKVPTGTTGGTPSATQQVVQSEGSVPKRESGTGSGPSTKAGSGDSTVSTAAVVQEGGKTPSTATQTGKAVSTAEPTVGNRYISAEGENAHVISLATNPQGKRVVVYKKKGSDVQFTTGVDSFNAKYDTPEVPPPGPGAKPKAEAATKGAGPAPAAKPAATATAPTVPTGYNIVKADDGYHIEQGTGDNAVGLAGPYKTPEEATDRAWEISGQKKPAAAKPVAAPAATGKPTGEKVAGDEVSFVERANGKEVMTGKIVGLTKNIPTGKQVFSIQYTNKKGETRNIVLQADDPRMRTVATTKGAGPAPATPAAPAATKAEAAGTAVAPKKGEIYNRPSDPKGPGVEVLSIRGGKVKYVLRGTGIEATKTIAEFRDLYGDTPRPSAKGAGPAPSVPVTPTPPSTPAASTPVAPAVEAEKTPTGSSELASKVADITPGSKWSSTTGGKDAVIVSASGGPLMGGTVRLRVSGDDNDTVMSLPEFRKQYGAKTPEVPTGTTPSAVSVNVGDRFSNPKSADVGVEVLEVTPTHVRYRMLGNDAKGQPLTTERRLTIEEFNKNWNTPGAPRATTSLPAEKAADIPEGWMDNSQRRAESIARVLPDNKRKQLILAHPDGTWSVHHSDDGVKVDEIGRYNTREEALSVANEKAGIPTGTAPAAAKRNITNALLETDAKVKDLSVRIIGEWDKGEGRDYNALASHRAELEKTIAPLRESVFEEAQRSQDFGAITRIDTAMKELVKNYDDPDDKYLLKLQAALKAAGIDPKAASIYARFVKTNAMDEVRNKANPGNLNLFAAGDISKFFDRMKTPNKEIAWWNQKIKDAATHKPFRERLDKDRDSYRNVFTVFNWIRNPTTQESIASVGANPDAPLPIRMGAFDRQGGPEGRTISRAFTNSEHTVNDRMTVGRRKLEEVQRYIEAHAAESGIKGNKVKQVFDEFINYIEMDKTDQRRLNAPPKIKKALELYDGITEGLRQSHIDYMRNTLGQTVDDKWGLTESGYFKHMFLKDFTIEVKNASKYGLVPSGTQADTHKLPMDNYLQMMAQAKEWEAQGIPLSDIEFRARSIPDVMTGGMSPGRFFKYVNSTLKNLKDPNTGQFVIPPQEVADDYRTMAKVPKDFVTVQTKHIGSLMKRALDANGKLANPKGWERDWHYVTSRMLQESVEGQEITKLRRQVAPILEKWEAGNWSEKQMAGEVRAMLDMISHKPTKMEIALANTWGRIPNIRGGTNAMRSDPIAKMKVATTRMQAAAYTVALRGRPAAAFYNALGPLSTLGSRVHPKDFAEAYWQYAKPSTRARLRDEGIMGGKIELVPDPNNKGAFIPRIVSGSHPLKAWNWFTDVSAMNRAVGYLYGERLARQAIKRGVKLTEAQVRQEGLTWAHVTEFRQTPYHMPPVTQSDTGKFWTQFQGYTINNLEDWWQAAHEIGKPVAQRNRGTATLQIGKKVTTQVALGGVKSVGFGLAGIGTKYYVEDWLDKHFGKKPLNEQIAQMATYGVMSGNWLGVDASANVSPIPDVLQVRAGREDRGIVERVGAFFTPPSLNMLERQISGIKKGLTKNTWEEFREDVLNSTPFGKEVEAVISWATGKPIYFPRVGGVPGQLKETKEKAVQAAGFTAAGRTEQHEVANRKRQQGEPHPLNLILPKK